MPRTPAAPAPGAQGQPGRSCGARTRRAFPSPRVTSRGLSRIEPVFARVHSWVEREEPRRRARRAPGPHLVQRLVTRFARSLAGAARPPSAGASRTERCTTRPSTTSASPTRPEPRAARPRPRRPPWRPRSLRRRPGRRTPLHAPRPARRWSARAPRWRRARSSPRAGRASTRTSPASRTSPARPACPSMAKTAPTCRGCARKAFRYSRMSPATCLYTSLIASDGAAAWKSVAFLSTYVPDGALVGPPRARLAHGPAHLGHLLGPPLGEHHPVLARELGGTGLPAAALDAGDRDDDLLCSRRRGW